MGLRGLAGRVVIVTGAARGIGAAVVDRLLAEGCRVVAADLVADGLGPFDGRDDVAAVTADIARADDCERMVGAALERFGAVHGLVHSAGIFGAVGPLAEMDVDAFDRVIAVNVRGTMLAMRAVLPAMIAQGEGGAIVCLASVTSFRTGAGRAAYAASKRAVLGLVAAAAVENGPHRIRVNAVAPGSTDTPMMRGSGALRESIVANQRGTPLGRLGEPGEIAAAAAWLVSDESSFVTGTCLVADGGFLI